MNKFRILVILFFISSPGCFSQQPKNTANKAPQTSASVKAEIAEATRAILSAPTAENYCARGQIYGRNKYSTQAVEDLTKAIQLKPNKAFYWFARGAAYSDLRDWKRAINDGTKAISLSKKGDFVYVNSLRLRGHCYYESGQQKMADAQEAALAAVGAKP